MGETRVISIAGKLENLTVAPDPTGRRRVFLFLQGHPSRLWRDLGEAVSGLGHQVEKVHFSVADMLFWGRRGGRWFRGTPEAWPKWLGDLLVDRGVTDIVYYNDCFPYHRMALTTGQRLGLRTWCVEFGYLRPDWITLEPGGMGGRSHLKSAPIERLAEYGSIPDMTRRYPHDFASEAWHEVVFNLLQCLTRPLNPGFRPDRLVNPIVEYLGWSGNLLRATRDRQDLDRIEIDVTRGRYPFFLVPLQMEGDYQVRTSRYSGMDAFLEDVLASFSAYAPQHLHLLVKAHPLESGLRDWRKQVKTLARRHGIENRVHYFRGGDLGHFAAISEGLVTLNSTSGMEAIRLRTPTIVLGEAVYERPGLTHQSGLDSFWTDPAPVDPKRLNDFLKALSLVQVKGSFYNPEGRRIAVSELARRMADRGPQALHSLLRLV